MRSSVHLARGLSCFVVLLPNCNSRNASRIRYCYLSRLRFAYGDETRTTAVRLIAVWHDTLLVDDAATNNWFITESCPFIEC